MLKHSLLACLTALSISILSAQEEKTAPKVQEETAARAELPSGESIMDKYVEATGGAEAYKKIKNTVAKGTFELVTMGIKADMTIYSAEPNLHFMELEIPGMGKILEGCNGAIAWSYSAMAGPSIKEGKEAEEALNEAIFHDYDWKTKYSSATTEGIEKVEGEECYKVIVKPRTGNPRTHYYSKETGLLVRIDAISETPMGELAIEIIHKDYKKVDGVMVPHQLINNAAGQTTTMKITEVKNNVEIPKSTFEPPEEIKSLLK
jgi:outer membrane lipoprotein-sorting protein